MIWHDGGTGARYDNLDQRALIWTEVLSTRYLVPVYLTFHNTCCFILLHVLRTHNSPVLPQPSRRPQRRRRMTLQLRPPTSLSRAPWTWTRPRPDLRRSERLLNSAWTLSEPLLMLSLGSGRYCWPQRCAFVLPCMLKLRSPLLGSLSFGALLSASTSTHRPEA